MGVLDDAIREHLELKRRHGASDAEIARQEAEALGPARRGPAAEPAEAVASEPDQPAEAAAPVAETEPVAAAEPAPAAVEPTVDVPADTVPPEAPDAAAAEPPGSPAHLAEDPAVADAGREPAVDLPPVHDVDRDPLEPPPPVPGATVEFDTLSAPDDDGVAEPPRDAAAAEGDEDVLEETPEFLRETPEHDRLWFEQKPPRDFDLED